MSIDSSCPEFLRSPAIDPVLDVHAAGFPSPSHPAEPDLFSRQQAMPGHDQARLEGAHIMVVGCGGLGSWIALALAQMGVRRLTLVDPDLFDRTNAPRQLMAANDLGQPKAHSVAKRVATHMLNVGTISGIARGFPGATEFLQVAPSALIVGVDNNRARFDGARYAHALKIPAAFTMISTDGTRIQAILQRPGGPCLCCMLPDLDADSLAPCAAASVVSCWLAATHAVQMLAAAIMGRTSPTWRESSLTGDTERVGSPTRRADCSVCNAA